ncbi:hypothetical protein [Hoeflea sp.]|uniref:hypothetical protein n=1 Tax=Hoeflea sp. TaxID=1940281 RepID=UPI003A8CDE4B
MNTPIKTRKRGAPAPKPANDNSNLRDRLNAARIGWREAVLGAIAWGAAMAISAQASMWLSTGAQTSHYWVLTALLFAGGALAWPFSLAAFRVVAFRKAREAAFAAAVLCLSLSTIIITATIYAIIYRNFYAQWHGDPFTKLWLLQLAFTSAAAFYQFAVLGLRLYLPLGLVFLLAAAWLLARGRNWTRRPARSRTPVLNRSRGR